MEDNRKPCTQNKKISNVTIGRVLDKGGNSIVYHAEQNENGTISKCVIKEYYPRENNIISGACYDRDPSGMLRILSDNEKEIIREKENQANNIERELRANQYLLYDGKKDVSNCPYIYRMVKLDCIDGDTSYLKIDTGVGKTVRELVNEGSIRLSDAIDYAEKILTILDYVYTKKHYVHGDMAAENLWVSGEGSQRQMKLLDFGSAFQPKEYRVKDIYDDSKVVEMANRILDNVALGSSHGGTRSVQILDLNSAKATYSLERGRENALRLIKAVSSVTVATDIFSCLRILYLMTTGTEYNGNASEDVIFELLPSSCTYRDHIAFCLSQIMKNNDNMKYDTIKKAKKAVNELSRIVHGNGITSAAIYEGSRMEDKEFVKPAEPINLSLLGQARECPGT